MSERTAEHDRLLEAAMAAALKALADATDDAETAEALWQQLAAEMFVDQMRLLGAAEAGAFAAMTNIRLARDHVPWRIKHSAE
jgi:hypothetical protein